MKKEKDKTKAIKEEEEPETAPSTVKETEPKKNVIEETVHIIVFKLGTEDYAIRIEQVREVTVTPSITRMPRTPHFIKGVANVRGDIIAIMDLEERFGLRPAPITENPNPNFTYTLVIEAKEYSIGVIVREVPQSLNVGLSRIDRTPAFLQDVNVHENYIEGIAKVDNRLIIILDMYKILTQEEIKELAD